MACAPAAPCCGSAEGDHRREPRWLSWWSPGQYRSRSSCVSCDRRVGRVAPEDYLAGAQHLLIEQHCWLHRFDDPQIPLAPGITVHVKDVQPHTLTIGLAKVVFESDAVVSQRVLQAQHGLADSPERFLSRQPGRAVGTFAETPHLLGYTDEQAWRRARYDARPRCRERIQPDHESTQLFRLAAKYPIPDRRARPAYRLSMERTRRIAKIFAPARSQIRAPRAETKMCHSSDRPPWSRARICSRSRSSGPIVRPHPPTPGYLRRPFGPSIRSALIGSSRESGGPVH